MSERQQETNDKDNQNDRSETNDKYRSGRGGSKHGLGTANKHHEKKRSSNANKVASEQAE